MSRLADLGAELDRLVPAALREHGVPGAAVVAIDGEDELVRCFGLADAERGEAVGTETLFQVGSVTKTLTGTLLAQLVAEGALDLDQPVRAYVPDLKLRGAGVAEAVTARHLLAHVAGLEGDVFIDTGDGDDALARYVAALDAAPQVAPFDWTHSYCNAGYSILGRVVGVLRGCTFEQAARRYVLDRLEMRRSGFAWEEPSPPAASGHVLLDGAPRVVRPWGLFRSIAPAGGLVTSPREIVAYARCHLGDRPDVLSREVRERMRAPLYDAAKSPLTLGWSASRAGTLEVLSHGGSTVSHIAHLALVPERRFAFAVLTNGDRGGAVVRAASRAMLEDHLGAPPATAARVVQPPRRLSEHTGRYRAAIYDVTVGSDGEGVWLEAVRRGGMDAHQRPRPAPLPRMRLDFTADDRAVVRGGPFAEMPVWFARDAAGRVRWVKFYGRLTPRVAADARTAE